VEVVASLSEGRTTAAQCGLFTYKSVPVIFEPPCTPVVEAFPISTAARSKVLYAVKSLTLLQVSEIKFQVERYSFQKGTYITRKFTFFEPCIVIHLCNK